MTHFFNLFFSFWSFPFPDFLLSAIMFNFIFCSIIFFLFHRKVVK